MTDEKKPYYQRVAETVIEALEKGTAPWVKPWSPGRLPEKPINAVSGKAYRGINRIMLGMSDEALATPDDPRWCTYKQAQELGGQVKRGSQGTVVQYWQFEEERLKRDDQGKPILGEDGQKQYESARLEKPRVFFSTVFHASQIENMPPLPSKEKLDWPKQAWERRGRAEKILTNSEAKIFHDQPNQAFYRPSSDEIHLPKPEQFATADRYYATALHELGHWTGHESRLNRDLKHPFGSEPYAREELRAELASYMLGTDLGIGHDPSQHHAYIASWIEALKKDPQEIIRAARDADRIAEYVKGMELAKDQGKETDIAQFQDPLTREERSEIERKKDMPPEAPTLAAMAAAEIKRAIQDMSRWNDLEAAKEANGYGLFALQELANGNMPEAIESLNKAAEVEAANGANTALSFTNSLAILHEAQQERATEQAAATRPPLPASEKTWLQVPYLEREEAKAAGAKWDRAEKSWYAPKGTDLTPLEKWLPDKDFQYVEQGKTAFDLGKAAFLDNKRYVPLEDKDWTRLVQDATSGMETVLAFKRTAELAQAWQKGWAKEQSNARVRERKSDTLDPRQEFGGKLRQAGLIIEGEPLFDGKIHRVAVEGGNKGAKDGAYSSYENDGHPGGWWQNHKTGEQGKWRATGHVLSAEHKAELKAECIAAIEALHKKTLDRAKAKWQAASQDKDAVLAHPYLQNKAIATLGLAKLIHPYDLPRLDKNGNLLVPGYNFETGEIQTLQTIGANGEKRFQRGCQKSGASYLFPAEETSHDNDGKQVVLLAEGYATGASIHAATGLPVAVAFDAGNLKEAALAIKKKLPNAAITICADNDHNRPDGKNIGIIKAKEVAAAVGGKIVVPEFLPNEKKKGLTDFNDLQQARGLSEVRKQVDKGVFAERAVDKPQNQVGR